MSPAVAPCSVYVPHWWEWYPPIGTCIAILGLLGVLVPLYRQRDKIHRFERAGWTLLMFILLGLELRTIYLDRAAVHGRDYRMHAASYPAADKRLASRGGSALSIRNLKQIAGAVVPVPWQPPPRTASTPEYLPVGGPDLLKLSDAP
jgi:hypothetical protein